MFGRKSNDDAAPRGPSILDRILLVVDGAEPSIAAAHFAVNLAAENGGSIAAVFVVDTATMDYLMQMHIFVKEEREEFERDLERTGQRYLDHVAALAGKKDVAVTPHLERGTFHKTILAAARKLPADVIVMGGWHRTITRKDTTSVERQLILDEASCPVLVIKSERAE